MIKTYTNRGNCTFLLECRIWFSGWNREWAEFFQFRCSLWHVDYSKSTLNFLCISWTQNHHPY